MAPHPHKRPSIPSIKLCALINKTIHKTAAADQIPVTAPLPKAERQRRSKILHAVSEEKTSAFYAQHAGRTAVVLWESKKEGDQMSGFTDNYIKVYGPYKKEKINTFEEIVL